MNVQQQHPAEATDSLVVADRGNKRLLLALALTLGAAFLAALLIVRLGKGQIVVQSEGELPQDVVISLTGGGKQLEIRAADQWTLSVKPGAYVVDIKGGNDTLEIKEHEIHVKRFGKQIIKITRQSPEVAKQTDAVTPPGEKIDVTGTWAISEAENLEGQAYGGAVRMRMLAENIVELEWFDDQRNSVQTGVGLIQDGHLLAAWSVGRAYGFCLYKTQPDGTMQGRWTLPGAGRWSTETASGGVPGKLEGTYQIEGTPLAAGGNYKGTLSVTRLGEAYAVHWTTADGGYRGIGLKHGEYLAIGWSLSNAGGFGAVDYKLEGDLARGRWTMIGDNRLSFEILKRGAVEQPR